MTQHIYGVIGVVALTGFCPVANGASFSLQAIQKMGAACLLTERVSCCIPDNDDTKWERHVSDGDGFMLHTG